MISVIRNNIKRNSVMYSIDFEDVLPKSDIKYIEEFVNRIRCCDEFFF